MPRPPPPPVCPVDALLRVLTGSWTSYILWHLRRDGPMRFGKLLRAIPGLSAKVLTQRLRMLEERGIVYRDHVPSIPPAVSYDLTAQGKELGGIFDALEDVSSRWLARAHRASVQAQALSPARPAARATRRRLNTSNEEQRRQRVFSRDERARSAVSQPVRVLVGEEAGEHAVLPAQASGHLPDLG